MLHRYIYIYNLWSILWRGQYGQEKSMRKFKHIFEDPLHGAVIPKVAGLYCVGIFRDILGWLTQQKKWNNWQSAKDQFPTYYSMIQLVMEGAVDSASMRAIVSVWGLFFKFVGCWIVPLQPLYSGKGRTLWIQVAKNYVMYFFISAGYWTRSCSTAVITYWEVPRL